MLMSIFAYKLLYEAAIIIVPLFETSWWLDMWRVQNVGGTW
jgi:hypothetical protein